MLLLFACAGPDVADAVPSEEPAVVLSDLQVSVHPEIGSLLVVTWTQSASAEVSVEYGLDGEPTLTSPPQVREAGAHEQLVIGAPYDSAVTVRVRSGDVVSEDVLARTDPLPENVPIPELEGADAAAWGADDRWLLIGLSSGGDGWESEGFWKLIVDRQGRIVWAHETPEQHRTFYMQPSADGTHIVWDQDTFWTDFDDGDGSQVHRMTLDGAVTESVPTPGLHHAFLDLGDGVVAWGGVEGPQEVLRERAADGTTREVWDCTAFWEAHNARSRCDGNALSWSAGTGTYLFSSDNENTVVEIDRASGEVLRYFGQLEGAMPFAAGTVPFSKQHSPNWTDAGTLLLSSWTSGTDHQVIAREFAVDEEAGELREIWRCGEGTGTIGEYAGEAHRLSNGNTLLNYGGGGEIREYTADCTEVWHLSWPYANVLGRSVFLSDLYDYL